MVLGNKYNNTFHRAIKMKPVDVKSRFIDFDKKNNKEDPKFKIGDHVRISKTYVVNDLKGEGLIGMFSKKELQKTNVEEM